MDVLLYACLIYAWFLYNLCVFRTVAGPTLKSVVKSLSCFGFLRCSCWDDPCSVKDFPFEVAEVGADRNLD